MLQRYKRLFIKNWVTKIQHTYKLIWS